MPTLELQSASDTAPWIYYERIKGRVNRPCLVFLHEGLGCTSMWKGFPEKLCERTGCPGLVYDRQGYGQSSALTRPRTIHYLHEYAVFELPQVLSALVPDQDVILVGHSDGGSIALIHGAAVPVHLAGIITEAAHVFVEDVTLDGIELADQAYEAGKFKGLNKYHADKTHQIFKAWSDTWRRRAFRAWNIEYLLPSITCPLLVVQGADDQYATWGQVDSIVDNTFGPSSAVRVDHCGHIPHLEQPEQMLDVMSRFILDLVTG